MLAKKIKKMTKNDEKAKINENKPTVITKNIERKRKMQRKV